MNIHINTRYIIINYTTFTESDKHAQDMIRYNNYNTNIVCKVFACLKDKILRMIIWNDYFDSIEESKKWPTSPYCYFHLYRLNVIVRKIDEI